jgi:hypothetical protein
LTKVFVTACHLGLKRFDKIFHDMKAVSNRHRLRGAFPTGCRIIFAPIPAHIADFGMLSHPRCCTLGGSLWQQVEHLVRAQINQDRAKRASALEREIVDAQGGNLVRCGLG